MTVAEIVTDIARRMRAARLNKKGLSLEAGLGETYVRDLLTGRSKNPKTEQLRKLTDALDRIEAEARGVSKKGRR